MSLKVSAGLVADALAAIALRVVWQDFQEGGKVAQAVEVLLNLRALCPPCPGSRWWW